MPSLPTGNWPCMSGSDGRCRWPEQVFFDGKPLRQVAGSPRSGQFALDSDRRVLLADNPAGHTIEVTTRSFWIKAASEGVTVQGFTMRHAASPAQRGAIDVRGYANWTIRGNVLSDVHGTVVYIDGPSNVNLLDNDISRGGQQGVNGSGDGTVIRGNRIYENNTEGFDPAWEAGGLKITRARNLIIDGNEAFNNDGPGLWCDIDCDGAVFTNNRAHHNARQGIAYEISHGGTIAGNAVWENGWGFSDWGWGAGILCNTCDSTEIRDNIAAWNADGIVVGRNFRFGHGGTGTADWLASFGRTHGISVEVPSMLTCEDGKPISSTRIRRLVATADVATVLAELAELNGGGR